VICVFPTFYSKVRRPIPLSISDYQKQNQVIHTRETMAVKEEEWMESTFHEGRSNWCKVL